MIIRISHNTQRCPLVIPSSSHLNRRRHVVFQSVLLCHFPLCCQLYSIATNATIWSLESVCLACQHWSLVRHSATTYSGVMRGTAWSPAPPGRTSIQSTVSTSLNRHSTSQLPQLSQPPLYSQEHLSTSQPLICLQCPHSVLVLLCRSTVSSSYLSGSFPTTRTCSNQPSCHLQTGSARSP